MMVFRRFTAALTLLAIVACMATPGGGGARATESGGAAPGAPTPLEETALAAAGTAAGWCVRGATFAVLFSAAFSVPSMLFGGGAPYSAMRAGTAAMMGCGVAVTWRTAAKGVAYIDALINPMPPTPADPPPRAMPASQRAPLINTSFPATY